MCFDYIAENLMVSRFFSHFGAPTRVTTYIQRRSYRERYHVRLMSCPGLTSRILLDPGPFDRIFGSVVFLKIIALFFDFDDSQKIEVSTKIKIFSAFCSEKCKYSFPWKKFFGVIGTLSDEHTVLRLRKYGMGFHSIFAQPSCSNSLLPLKTRNKK